ncbi:MAG: type II toxin-antitoxin system RelB/DinJ family antitoxin [bacterium]|nr:type II toxin-antitoxin system RelB/DinJ family antitoxin [bacterium]
MNTTVINIKTNAEVKSKAQAIAEELGLSLSAVINSLLKQFVRTKSLKIYLKEEPSPYLIKALKESEEDIKKGRVSTVFTNSKDAIAWLSDNKRKYEYQVRKKIRKTV